MTPMRFVILAVTLLVASVQAAVPPKVSVSNIRRVFHNGEHNAFKGEGATTSLYWLVGDDLQEFAEFPSGGDNSYPGFVALSPTRALVSYYSSHEQDAAGKTITAIYMAELTLKP